MIHPNYFSNCIYNFAENHERVELSAALIFWFAAGAIVAPVVASQLIENLGPNSMFAMISVIHALLALIGILRMRVRPTVEERTPYVYVPRTSFLIGRLLRRKRR